MHHTPKEESLYDVVLNSINAANDVLWSWPMILMLLGVGIYLAFLLRFVQFRKLGEGLMMALPLRKNIHGEGDISHFQSLMTALAATVGTGNIAGVATAIVAGGPGAIFWMWISGLLGMGTKYSEAVLGVYYRVKNEKGEMNGGPMYYIRDGLRSKWLAALFAIFLVMGALVAGNMIQINSIVEGMHSAFDIPKWDLNLGSNTIALTPVGIVVAIAVAFVLLGGIHRTGKTSAIVVPFMILLYVGAGMVVLCMNAEAILPTLKLIFTEGISSTQAMVGGAIGAAIKAGLSRGIFSNESGMGSAPIVAANARTCHPVEQAEVSMTQTFIDTMVVCTFTALIILTSGLYQGGELNGVPLTSAAFSAGLGVQAGSLDIGAVIVAICVSFFAFSTILGWSVYGEKGVSYLFGEKGVPYFKTVWIISVVIGSAMTLDMVWALGILAVGLMVIPNVIALFFLSGKIRALTKDYYANKETRAFKVKPFFHKDAG